jgi:hypothetical protein
VYNVYKCKFNEKKKVKERLSHTKLTYQQLFVVALLLFFNNNNTILVVI